jgi:hypothetical protein
MAAVEREVGIVEQVHCELSSHYPAKEGTRTVMAFDRERGQFLSVDEGWQGSRRIHQVWAHVELRDGKMWVHEDGTEEGIANRLVAAGVPRDRIVLVFHAPELRWATEFAPS